MDKFSNLKAVLAENIYIANWEKYVPIFNYVMEVKGFSTTHQDKVRIRISSILSETNLF